MRIETSYGDVKIKKRDLEEGDPQSKMSNKQVAVVIAGNGIAWDDQAWIWLDCQTAYEMAEANAIELIDEQYGPEACTKVIGDYTVFAYELPR